LIQKESVSQKLEVGLGPVQCVVWTQRPDRRYFNRNNGGAQD
jgi:hypothetical protein